MANQTRQLARLLEQEGIDVSLVQTNAPYRPLWVRSLRGVRALFRLWPFVRRLWHTAGHVDLFHVMANSGWAWHLFAAPAILIAKLRRVPVIVNYRGGHAEAFLIGSLFWIRPTLRLTDRLVVPSGFLQDVFGRFGFTAEIVPNIVDLTRFVPRTQGTALPRDNPHLVVTRNLELIYDVATGIHALAIIKKTRPGARMTIAGSGPESANLAELVQQLGLQGCVTFTGTLDNERMSELYRTADVFLNTSLVDNMPISILEALASGVPVVSTNVGGIPYVVEHDRTGLLVPPRDAHATAEAVLELLDSPERAEGLVAAGREYVQQYAWHAVRRRLLEVYSALAPKALNAVAATTK